MQLRRSNIISKDVVAIVLAGGKGERLDPLTRHRSKPAVPFGGIYRIVDFTLSNCLNSGLRKIYVLTQYKSASLERHIKIGWDALFPSELDEWIHTVPPQLRVGQRWYLGTADAVYQNTYLLERVQPRRVVVLSGDHVYKMDYQKFMRYHVKKGAIATVAAVEVPREQASAFGVLRVDEQGKVVAFVEKPADPPSIPGRPDWSLANMGAYVFETEPLIHALQADSAATTRHDFGHDILPAMLQAGGVYAYPFVDENKKRVRYWRDIGTLDAYYEASLDLVAVHPVFNLYDQDWPIRTARRQLPPAKTVFAQDEPGGRRGVALDSIVGAGTIISGGHVERSVLSPHVRVNSYSRVEDSVLLDGVEIGRHARVRRAIVDKRVIVPPEAVVGEDEDEDRRRFTVTENGIIVITRDMSSPDRADLRALNGVADDPDQIIVGAQFDFGDVARRVYLEPNIELGVGDDHTILTTTGALHYRFKRQRSLRPHVGAGLTLGLVHFDPPNRGSDTEFEIALKLIGGVSWTLKSKREFFLEAALIAGDLQDAQVMAGWRF